MGINLIGKNNVKIPGKSLILKNTCSKCSKFSKILWAMAHIPVYRFGFLSNTGLFGGQHKDMNPTPHTPNAKPLPQ